MIEWKKVYLNIDYVNEYLESLHYFGWINCDCAEEIIDNKLVKYQLLNRDTQINNYSELVELEKEYEKNKNELLPTVKINGLLFFFLLVLFIIPGMLYFELKSSDIELVNKHNNLFYKNIYEILEKAKQLIDEDNKV